MKKTRKVKKIHKVKEIDAFECWRPGDLGTMRRYVNALKVILAKIKAGLLPGSHKLRVPKRGYKDDEVRFRLTRHRLTITSLRTA